MALILPETPHWQPAHQGEGYLTDLDDILRCVHTILETPIGSDPLRPDFGSRLYEYVDTPFNVARPHLVRETVEPIRKWEPRVAVKRVVVSLKGLSNTVIEPFLELANGVVISTEVLPWRYLK